LVDCKSREEVVYAGRYLQLRMCVGNCKDC